MARRPRLFVADIPLRGGITDSPELYPWSSYRVRAFDEKSSVLDLDLWYNSLGSNKQERQLRYRQFFQNLIPERTLKLIREMTNKGGIIGSINFKEQIEKILPPFRSQGHLRDDKKHAQIE